MNGQVFPLFEHTHILRTGMLTELRDYAYEYGRLMYEGYSDGIVSGCSITTTKDTISLNRGIIRYAENMYFITEPITVSYKPTDIWMVFRLCFKDETKLGGYIYREVTADLSDQLTLSGSEMELCRFKLKMGARLRMKYADFEDRGTEFDTVNTIYAPFAAYERSSLAPDITRAFALEASAYHAEPVDTAFCLQALSAQGAVPRQAILLYLAVKLQREIEEMGNKEIFDAFRSVLRQLKAGGRREASRVKRAKRQIIVD